MLPMPMPAPSEPRPIPRASAIAGSSGEDGGEALEPAGQMVLELREFLDAQRQRLVDTDAPAGIFANASMFRGSHVTDLWQINRNRRFVIAELDGEKIMSKGE